MHISTTIGTNSKIRAWRIKGDPDIWFSMDYIGMRSATSLPPAEAQQLIAEAQQLIAELQRELAAVEAEARGAAA